jgi:SAM-dependent methyltransferase
VPEAALDARLARRRFDRAAASYARASRLESEIGVRMLERLDYMKLAPRRVLDAGSGPGRDGGRLAKRYPQAQVIALDFSERMLRQRRGFLSRLLVANEKHSWRGERMPIAPASIGMVCPTWRCTGPPILRRRCASSTGCWRSMAC